MQDEREKSNVAPRTLKNQRVRHPLSFQRSRGLATRPQEHTLSRTEAQISRQFRSHLKALSAIRFWSGQVRKAAVMN